MARVYYIKNRRGRGGKFYNSEKTFLEAMRSDDTRLVTIYEECDRGSAGEIFESIIKGKERDDQLKVVLGDVDKYEESIYKFREVFTEIAPERQEKRSILRAIKLHGLNKPEFSAIASKYKNFLHMKSVTL